MQEAYCAATSLERGLIYDHGTYASGLHFVERMLVPTLTPGQIVVLDNHRIHKGDKVAELLTAHGCPLLFLPPYSPDLHPIEEARSKVKTFVKACQARARVTLDSAIAAALKTISLQDILGWFGHSGYNLRYQ